MTPTSRLEQPDLYFAACDRRGRVEVRFFVPRGDGSWHRAGTWSAGMHAWRLLRRVLLAGAKQLALRIAIDDLALNAQQARAHPSRET